MPDYEIPIPPKSRDAFHAYKGVTNPGLIFDRFAPRWSRGGENAKKQGLERVARAKGDASLLREWNARWEACARAACAEPFALQTDWRFVAGLGRKGPLEVGFTFHRYGFPILPGSSVKGIARASALSLHGVEESDADFIAIFGRAPERGEDESVAQAGSAVFFDAIPAHVPKLELDVMNPHFPKYYQGEAPPTDWQSPIPVYFLTVAPKSEFRFAIGWRGALDDEGRRRRDLATQWLISGLTELGAGAKTNAGYGYFVEAAMKDMRPVAAPVTTQQIPAEPPKPQPPAELKRGEGRLRREGPNKVWIQDGASRVNITVETLGKDAFNSLPSDKTDVIYEYDEVDGRRRVWKVQRKAKL